MILGLCADCTHGFSIVSVGTAHDGWIEADFFSIVWEVSERRRPIVAAGTAIVYAISAANARIREENRVTIEVLCYIELRKNTHGIHESPCLWAFSHRE